MKKYIGILAALILPALLAACSEMGAGKESSYSLTIRNSGANAVTLKNVKVNDNVYLNRDMELAALNDAGNSDYLVLFMSGQTVKVTAVIYDEVLGKETAIAERVIDNAGEGYAILIEYNAGAIKTDASKVGRLSAWGSQ